jgi:hypothetical protein
MKIGDVQETSSVRGSLFCRNSIERCIMFLKKSPGVGLYTLLTLCWFKKQRAGGGLVVPSLRFVMLQQQGIQQGICVLGGKVCKKASGWPSRGHQTKEGGFI